MNNQLIFKILIILTVTILVVKFVDFEEPFNALAMRTTYYVSQFCIFCVYVWLMMQLRNKEKQNKDNEKMHKFISKGVSAVRMKLLRVGLLPFIISYVHFNMSGSFVPFVVQTLLNTMDLFTNEYFKYCAMKDKSVYENFETEEAKEKEKSETEKDK